MQNGDVGSGPLAGPQLRIRLFGTTEVVTRRGVRATGFGGVKPRQVLEVLATTPGQPVAKEKLADVIWEGVPPRSYMATLESYVSLLRRGLEEARGQHSAIRTTTAGYVLDMGKATVDLDETCRLIDLARRSSGSAAISLVGSALDLAHGELLASAPYSRWAGEQRATLNTELATACDHAAEVALDHGDHAEAIRLSREATLRDPLVEHAWQTLIRTYAAQGRFCEGLTAYQTLRGVLSAELGVEPAPTTRRLYQELLSALDAESDDYRTELSTLMVLLRQALEGVPGLTVPASDESLSGIAVRVLATA
jgi:DNA-binding SARP family transcriptional activator